MFTEQLVQLMGKRIQINAANQSYSGLVAVVEPETVTLHSTGTTSGLCRIQIRTDSIDALLVWPGRS